MKKTVKTIAVMLALAVAVAFSPIASVTAEAQTLTGYNATAAVQFAKSNTNNYHDCVKFVRACAEKGGVPVQKGNKGYEPKAYMNYLITEGFAVQNKLTLCGDEMIEGSTKYDNLCVEDNKGNLAAGDLLAYKCKKCGKFFHMAIVTDTIKGKDNSNNYWKLYAQTSNKTGNMISDSPVYVYEHPGTGHGRGNVEIYALHFTSTYNGFAACNKTVKKLKVKKVNKKKAKLSWKKTSGAVAYNIYAKGYAGGPVEFVKQVKGNSVKIAIPKNSKGKVYNYKNVKYAVAPVFKQSATFEGITKTYKVPGKKCKLTKVK